MIEVIPSNWMRKYLRDHNRELTECEKAAVIMHDPALSWDERLDSLQELSEEASDPSLKQQILDRIAFEKESLEKFKDHTRGNYVYLVHDNDKELYGCFADYETAYAFTLKCIERYCDDKYSDYFNIPYFEISRHIVCGKGQTDEPFSPDGILRISASGKIISFCSSEGEDYGENGEEYFAECFFRIPCGMDVGIVRIAGDTEYGVVDTSEELWEKYMASMSGPGWKFDDVQVTVRYLTEDGIWTHKHVNPLYLEPETPAFAEDDRAGSAWSAAADAMIKHLKEMTAGSAAAVTDTAEKYAGECRRRRLGI